MSSEDQALANRAIELALAGVQPYDIEFRVRLPDGTQRWIKANGLVTRDEAGQALTMTGINYDITERKNVEMTLLAAKHAAEAASVAKSSFLATMSHEIRTPMNGILGMLSLLKHTELTSRQLDYASKAESATRALLGIINDILDFSKVESGKLELDLQPVVLSDLLRELSVMLSSNLGDKQLEVLFAIDPGVPPVLIADDLRLRQVLLNLTGNAIKFTEQGEVVLAIRLLAREGNVVELEFSVRDSGIGIPAEKIEQIFEGFSQADTSTSRRFGGTGLGLAISRRLVALMGGELQVESVLGQGSRFHFSVRFEVSPGDVSNLPGAVAPALAHLRVLIVDDNAVSRQVLQGMATMMGWQSDSFASGEAAIAQLARADCPSYQVILMDWRMPGLDGWETTRRIRQFKQGADAPVVIMVTAAGREMLASKPKREAAMIDSYLVKPVTASILHDAVVEATVMHSGHAAARQARADTDRLGGLRLLVVEDNPLNQQIAKELLERSGARVEIAGSGIAGVDMALRANPPFDAILMDMQMPDIDGLEATRRIRAEAHMLAVPIIAMTANAMESDRTACLRAGMVDHVAKPIDMEILIHTLLHYVKPVFSPVLAERSEASAVSVNTTRRRNRLGQRHWHRRRAGLLCSISIQPWRVWAATGLLRQGRDVIPPRCAEAIE